MPTPNEVVEMHRRMVDNTSTLRIRWDEDEDRWNQKNYKEPQGKGIGYEQVTSNDFRAVGKKGISMLSGAAMKLQVPVGADKRTERDEDNAAEQFLRGNFKANDRLCINQGDKGTLIQAISWYLNIRGTTIGRAQLRKRTTKNGNEITWAEAMPWDVRDCSWMYGPFGLEWICREFAIHRTRAEKDWKIPSSLDKEQHILKGYDWYDGERNIVVIPDISLSTAVKDEIHGLVDGNGEPRVPGWVNANTLQPLITHIGEGGMTESQLTDGMVHFGESILADLRHPLEALQKLNSIRMELASRSREPGYTLKTREGNKSLDSAPYKGGPGISLQHEDEIEFFDTLRLAADADALQVILTTEANKGGFPAVSFGSTGGHDPSGFAITQLKGGVADKVMGAAQAGSAALMTIAEIWRDHFNTRAFDGIQLSGQGRNRKWFAAFITPDMIEDLPSAEIELVPELPEDSAGKIAAAIQLSTPLADGKPVLGRRSVLEDYLNRPDSDLDIDDVMNMMASSEPSVEAQRMTDSLANRGDVAGAMAWYAVEKMLVVERQRILLQLGVDPSILTEGFDPETDETRRGESAGFPPRYYLVRQQGYQVQCLDLKHPSRQAQW